MKYKVGGMRMCVGEHVLQRPEASSLDSMGVGTKENVRGPKGFLVGRWEEGQKRRMSKGIIYFLSPASASRAGRSSRELDDSMNLNIWCLLPEVPLGFKAPVKKAGNPMLQAFDVSGDKGV